MLGLNYDDVYNWVKVSKLVSNRVSIVNQIHGCQYERNCNNPCRVVWDSGTYKVLYCGEVLASYSVYDYEGVTLAYQRVDALACALWSARRCGYASLSPVGCMT